MSQVQARQEEEEEEEQEQIEQQQQSKQQKENEERGGSDMLAGMLAQVSAQKQVTWQSCCFRFEKKKSFGPC
jgi:hypothetical protein